MKSKLLVTTAALALMLSAGAQAQTRSETKPDQPSASQSQKEHGSTTKEMNRDARDTDRAKGGTTTGQSSPSASASDSKASSDSKTSDSKSSDSKSSPDSKSATDTKSDTRKPASAQDNSSPSHNNAAQSTDKSNDKASDKTNAAKQDDKNTSPDRSKQANEPRDGKSNTAGQTDSKQPSSAQRDTGKDRNQATTDSKPDGRSRDTAADSKSDSTTRISASLKTEQKTRLQQAVTRLDVKPVTNVNFSISVGTAVPRTVSLHPVPTTIVEIVPQYRGYDYFVVREEVIIVHPETHKIVDVIERGGGSSRASVSTTHEKRVNLSDKQRSYIRQHATSRRTTTTTTTTGSAPRGTTTIVVGEEVPQSVEIESFPEEVYREVPTVREYRYIRSGSNMYLVDPGTRHVIEEIE